MLRVISDTKKPIKIWASDLEPEAETQVRNLSTLPFIHSHVAVMPDAHAGRGSTVGTVIATRGAIIPAAVGVDIGCGMCAVKLPFKIDEFKDLPVLRHSIERSVPVGRNLNGEPNERTTLSFELLGQLSETALENMESRVLINAQKSLGTLGGGNHFIEICGDTEGGAWIMLHSGSRNIGKRLAEVHIGRAKELMKEYFISLPDPDLAYLVQSSPDFVSYIRDLMWAQKFAKANRDEMMVRIIKDVFFHVYGKDRAIDEMKKFILPGYLRIDCHHNYTALEHHFGQNIYVTRKGAVSAKDGELGIIPGSMGTRSYIVRGLGDADSFHSCSHGAGRRMSRTKAREMFKLEDLAAQTFGVECRKDVEVIDEIPGAYKDIDVVMENQRDLVRPLYELKQILCVKG